MSDSRLDPRGVKPPTEATKVLKSASVGGVMEAQWSPGFILLEHGASVPAGTPVGTLIFEKA